MSTTPAATTSGVSASGVSTWKIDPAHSSAEFKVKHMMISNVKGKFHGISGVLTLNEADITKSRIESSIDLSSLSTGDEQRDGHLKSPDFFEIEKYPTMTFKSTEVRKTGTTEFAVVGELNLHGVTRNVSFAVEELSQPGKDPYGNIRLGLEATTRINRKDFGLTWNSALETGGVLVGEDVQITLDIQFIKG
jgi:polyisoprenoid-binding protein YceI